MDGLRRSTRLHLLDAVVESVSEAQRITQPVERVALFVPELFHDPKVSRIDLLRPLEIRAVHVQSCPR